MTVLASPIAADSSNTTAVLGTVGVLVGAVIAGGVGLWTAKQTREAAERAWVRDNQAAERAWVRDNRRAIYDRFLTSGQRLLIACEARWHSRHDKQSDSAPIPEKVESGVESAHADFFEAYSVVQTVANTTLVNAARVYGYRFLALQAIMDSKGFLESNDFGPVAQFVRDARHDTIDAMRAELGLDKTIWPGKYYNPFDNTKLQEKYDKGLKEKYKEDPEKRQGPGSVG
jgi:hypothetical protein